jgi:predicted AlkP superfamily pyrophosphatase or phosphodiesterase
MNRLISLTIIFIANLNFLYSQTGDLNKPKLVVGIVVDQMRFDQLYRYQDRFIEGGFKRFLVEGFNFKNAHYNYVPTVTASGHASIYTGTTPSVHGIIGNSWYDRASKGSMGNVADSLEQIVGSVKKNYDGISPKNLLSTTIGDELRMSSNFRSKVFSISLKDRGSALPGGHTANAAYWYDWQTSPGHFVTSTYYMDKLPDYVKKFNELKKPNDYLDKPWTTLYPVETYLASTADDTPFERTLSGKEAPVFPYNYPAIRKIYRELNAEYQLVWINPGGNTLLTDLAKTVIENEALGKDEFTDLLNVGFSVPDVVGHTFGPQSVEMEDILLRLDIEIASLLKYLDQSVGKDAYTVFLTSDHGAIPVVSHLNANKIPTDMVVIPVLDSLLSQHLTSKYGEGDWIEEFDGETVFLNINEIDAKDLNLVEVRQESVQFLRTQPEVRDALTADQLLTYEYSLGMRHKMQEGFHPKRSGDMMLSFMPGFIQTSNSELSVEDVKGTTHGSGYAYDTHVPILWYGWGIPKGESVRKVSIIDIAPSLAMLLNLQLPSGSTGIPLDELFILD